MSEENRSGGRARLLLTGVLVAILVLALFAILFSRTYWPMHAPRAPGPTTAATAAPIPDVLTDLHLITPRLGDNFYSFGWSSTNQEFARDDNVSPALFFYDAAKGAIHAPAKHSGALTTKREYTNYVLTIEYTWGNKTHGERQGKRRIASVTVHGQGEHGAFSISLTSGYHVLLGEGDCGTVVLHGRPDEVQAMATGRPRKAKAGARLVFDRKEIARPVASGGKPYAVCHLDAPEGFEDVAGTHPPGDPTVPGKWNTMEIVCKGQSLLVRVNGKEVNHLTDLNRTGGKILLAPRYAEMIVRRIDVSPPR